ncbi:MAG TPA: hypothetical protein VFZ73_19985 [Gemmatimonadaceae bacterium]
MRRQVALGVIGLSMVAAPLNAQETGTTVTLTVSPSYVNFDGFGGGFGAAVARLSVSRGFTSRTGGELSVFALAPLGGATSIPGCVPGAVCRTTTTPSLLSGLLTSAFFDAGDTGLRLSLGVGGVTASGGEGFPHRTSGAGVAGLDWLPHTTNRFAPTIAVRVVQLASPIAGARQLLLPGLGFRF